jgi:glycosyltransferase involved in cell wall biosynthesis
MRNDGGPRPPPGVTIITVTFDRAHLLPRAIESVLGQDYPRLRLIVVDDGSTDETPGVLKRYQGDSRLIVMRHATNRGVLAARNTGLSALDTDARYFGYVDSDDLLLPGAIRTMVEAIERHGDRYSMACAWSRDGATGRSDGQFPDRAGELTFDDYISGRLSGDFMELVRCDLVDGLRYDERAGGGEGVLLAQLLLVKPALLIDEVVQVTDRGGADRISRVRHDVAYATGRMWTAQYRLDALGADIRERSVEHYAGLQTELARWAAPAGDGRRARAASREALRSNPSPRTLLMACFALAPGPLARAVAHFAADLRAFGRARSSRR